MLTPRVVCFDLGGVLVRICRTFVEACERAGLPLRDPVWLGGPQALEARRALMLAYQSGALSTAEYFERLSEALEARYLVSELEALHDAWIIEEYAGASSLVTAVAKAQGITTACLSNTNERHWEALIAAAPSAYPSVLALDQRFASHLMRANKPEPQIFQAFQNELGVDPDQILFFDDSEANVEAARLSGWRAELIDHLGDTVQQMQSHLFANGLEISS